MRIHHFLATLCLAGICNLIAQAEDPPSFVRFEQHKVVRVQVDSIRTLRTMLAISPDCWSESTGVGTTLDFRIPPDRMSALEGSGISYEVLIEDVEKLISAERIRLNQREGGIAGEDYFTEYHRTDGIHQHYDELMAANPELMTMAVIGTSREGREIRRYTITSGDPSTLPGIYITALCHAREWASGSTTAYLVDSLITQYGTNSELTGLVDGLAWHVVPVTNPDGYEYTWDTNRLWRKNRFDNGDGTFGVDLNRNYSAGWGGPGSSGSGSSDTYRGTAAFSEPETQAVRDDMESIGNVTAFFDVHCYSQLMLWPYGYDNTEPPGEAGQIHETIGTGMTDAIFGVNGKVFTPQPAHDLYLASGTSLDWAWDETGSYSWTFELRDTGEFGFLLPPEQIIPSGEEILAAFAYVGGQILGSLDFQWVEQPPALVEPGTSPTATVQMQVIFGSTNPLTAQLVSSINGGPQQFTPMSVVGINTFSADLPAADCGDRIEYFFQINTSTGSTLTAMDGDQPFTMDVAEISLAFEDDSESDLGWTLGVPGDTATTGIWVRVDPNGTGAQPEDDTTPGAGTLCFVTGQGSPGGSLGENDVDGGITTLLSPTFDATSANDVVIQMNLWYSNNQGASPGLDSMPIEISNNGGTDWVLLEDFSISTNAWIQRSYSLDDYIEATNQMRLRFIARDLGDGSVVEAGVDDVSVFGAGCPDAPCPGDLNGDGIVDGGDLGLLLVAWNTAGADLNGDGTTDGADIGLILSYWGDC